MLVSMIDPSLFTIPYDRELMGGLAAAGLRTKLHGRKAGVGDNDTTGIDLDADFYRMTTTRVVAGLPGPVRLGLKGLDHLVSMVRLKSRLRREPPDIIHFQWLPLPFVDKRLLGGFGRIAPLVLTVHDSNPYNGDPSTVRSHGFSDCLDTFDHLIATTRQGRARLVELGVPDEKVSVVPLGLMESLPPQAPPVQMDGRLTLLMFGKIKHYKGVDVLLEAFAALPPALRAQARIRVIGKAYMPLEPLKELAKSRGVGDSFDLEPRFVPDSEVNGLFSPRVVAVFPYRAIDASAVLPYALANACPVIASALGDFAERLEDEREGLLVPPGDVAALAEALARMITDRDFAAKCGVRARKSAEATPDWGMIGRQTLDVYKKARLHAERERRTPVRRAFRQHEPGPSDPRGSDTEL